MIEIPKPKDRKNLDLLELVCQLHSRALQYPSKEMHDAYWEARRELEARLEQKELQQHSVMQGLPDSEIYRWLQSKNYQYSYDETQEYRMLFELDFPKIIREFVAEHQGSPTVGKEGGDASVSDGK